MFIFTNAAIDCFLIFIGFVIITQLVIPIWKNKKLFPLFRKTARAVAGYNGEPTPKTTTKTKGTK